MITEGQREQLVVTVDEWGMRRWWHAWCQQANPTDHRGPVTDAATSMWCAKFSWMAMIAWHIDESRIPAIAAGNLLRHIELWGAIRAEAGRMAAHPTIPVAAEHATDEATPGLRDEWLALLDSYTLQQPQKLALSTTDSAGTAVPHYGGGTAAHHP